jgi:hypothetical protein
MEIEEGQSAVGKRRGLRRGLSGLQVMPAMLFQRRVRLFAAKLSQTAFALVNAVEV